MTTQIDVCILATFWWRRGSWQGPAPPRVAPLPRFLLHMTVIFCWSVISAHSFRRPPSKMQYNQKSKIAADLYF